MANGVASGKHKQLLRDRQIAQLRVGAIHELPLPLIELSRILEIFSYFSID
jgi:hypothetical protein